jgi:hypothetical protein
MIRAISRSRPLEVQVHDPIRYVEGPLPWALYPEASLVVVLPSHTLRYIKLFTGPLQRGGSQRNAVLIADPERRNPKTGSGKVTNNV